MGYLSYCRGRSAVFTCDSCKRPSKPVDVKVFKFSELENATRGFSESNLLGKGSHSCVYRGNLEDGRVVAVKRPTVGRRALQDVSSFDNELEILSKLQHRHLVNLIGYCNEDSERLLVVEFMGNGTLYELLHCSSEPLSWPLRVHMALQAAKALLALHSASPPIIHRDVKSSNILVDGSWNAKVGDLGLALRGNLEDVVRQRTPPAGTMGYIDPEYETPSQLSTKSDVFSFGILLLEIMSGRNAIDVRYNPSGIVDWAVPLIKQGKALALCDPTLNPPQNAKVVKQLAAIAARCVRLSRDRRPSMADVVEGLRTIRRKCPTPRFGGKPARTTASSQPVLKTEPTESLSDSGSSCRSQNLSIFDEGSILDEAEMSRAESLIRSHTSIRKRLRNLSDSSRVSDSELFLTASGRRGELQIFDPNRSTSRDPTKREAGRSVVAVTPSAQATRKPEDSDYCARRGDCTAITSGENRVNPRRTIVGERKALPGLWEMEESSSNVEERTTTAGDDSQHSAMQRCLNLRVSTESSRDASLAMGCGVDESSHHSPKCAEDGCRQLTYSPDERQMTQMYKMPISA